MDYNIPSIEDQEIAVTNSEKKLLDLVNEHFPKGEDDYKPFRVMVKKLLPLLRDCPASASAKYHGAWCGGLLAHTVEVIKTALQVSDTVGPDILDADNRVDFLRSVVKCAYLHDIGKLGNVEHSYYLPQDNEWRANNLGEMFTINRDTDQLVYLPVPVRGLWLAQKFGVYVSEAEMQAVVASDGPQTPHGKQVVSTFLENPITMIIHFADVWVSQVRGI